MKPTVWVSLVLVAIVGGALLALSEDDQGSPPVGCPTVTERYLGEQEPGVTPKLFAPRVLGSDLHTPPIFAPDGAAAYWCTMDGRQILWTRFEDGVWQSPEILPFASVAPDSPFLSADGGRLYFTSFAGGLFRKRETIWYVERSAAGWGPPESLPFVGTPSAAHWAFSMTEDGTLYFGFDGEIYVAECNQGVYEPASPIGPPINSSGLDEMPYVSPDGSYMLFVSDGHADHMGNIDLYLSIHEADGSWGAPIHLPSPVNSAYQDLYPTISPDGRYLFFLSTRSGSHRAYWVDASVFTDFLP